jgi:hypothetical protein
VIEEISGVSEEIVMPLDGGGHVSVAVERSAPPTDLIEPLRAVVGQPGV